MAVNWEEQVLIPCTAVFGENDPAFAPCVYMPDDGSPAYPVVPIFDEEYQEVTVLDLAAPTSDARPVCSINAAQFVSPPTQDGMLYIPRGLAQWYLVKEVRPDGHGNFKLMLTSTDAP